METENVFPPEFDVSEIFSGLPSMLSETLGKALSDYIERITRKPEMEFRVHTIELHREVARANDTQMCDLMNDGWRLADKIIAAPFVMLIFNREKGDTECQ